MVRVLLPNRLHYSLATRQYNCGAIGCTLPSQRGSTTAAQSVRV